MRFRLTVLDFGRSSPVTRRPDHARQRRSRFPMRTRLTVSGTSVARRQSQGAGPRQAALITLADALPVDRSEFSLPDANPKRSKLTTTTTQLHSRRRAGNESN